MKDEYVVSLIALVMIISGALCWYGKITGSFFEKIVLVILSSLIGYKVGEYRARKMINKAR